MKRKILFILFAVLSLLLSVTASSVEAVNANMPLERASLSQKIEIIQQEIQLLKFLISSANLRQEINAGSYIVTNLSDNSVVFEKNADKAYPIASVTKLMNAVVALENVSMSQTITLTDEMLKPVGNSPSLFKGLKISAENLLKAALTQSVNDAAESLSYFLGNEKFIGLMNQKAKDIGMQNTVYYDAHGLNPANRSTSADLAKLIAYINKNHPEILSMTKDNNFWLPDQDGKFLKFKNENYFYYLSNFIGGKTGYLPEAKQSIASEFQVGEKQFAIVILYSNNRMADTFNILRQIQSKSLADAR